ncbi:hypothetical protein [Rurimicrobium arvi]|uniref:Uncharacterized protein n=1 Tax=Rurimicrobium arvi TaxID=2049916 RepID=A0ABP8MZV9_9BACT
MHHFTSNDHSPSEQPSLFGTTSIWTVAFSTIGGVYKAQAIPHLLMDSLTLDGSIAVMSYAFISAVVGYCTKKGLDYVFAKFRKK